MDRREAVIGEPRDSEKILQSVGETAAEIMGGVPDHHGLAHALSVEEYGIHISLSEKDDPFLTRLACKLHDLRWMEGGDRIARKVKPRSVAAETAEVPSVKDILAPLSREGKISPKNYAAIMLAIRKGSKLPPEAGFSRPTVRRLRDADRLSRSGVEGLLSTIEANEDYGEPFFNENDGIPIIRPPDAPLIPFKDIKSCITDINSCLDWENIMETDAGRSLVEKLNRVNRAFLETFAAHQNIKDYGIWIGWLEGIVDKIKDEREAIRQLLEQGEIEEYQKELIALEDPQLVSQENFEAYLDSREGT